MPTKSASLYRYVRNLSSSEIKAFRHFCSYQSGEKDYLKLFELLRTMKRYDEKKIEKAFAGTKLLANLTRTKDYLYDLIVRSLATYYHEPGAELNLLLREIEVERNRGQIKNAFRLVKRAKRLAEKEERFESWLGLLHTERLLLLSQVELKDVDDLLAGNRETWQKVQELLANYRHFLELETMVIRRERRKYLQAGVQDQQRIQQLRDDPLVRDEEGPLSIRAKGKWLRIRFEIARVERNHLEAVELLKNEIQLFESHVFLRFDQGKRYYDALYLLCLFHQLMRKEDAARELIVRLAQHYETTLYDKDRLFEYLALSQFSFGLAFENAVMAQKALDLLKNSSSHLALLGVESSTMLFWYAARVAIGRREFPEAKSWLQELFRLPKSIARTDLQVSARILYAIVLFEQQEWDDLHASATNYVRFIKKHKAKFVDELTVMQALKRFSNQRSDQKAVDLLRKLLSKLEESRSGDQQRYAQHYFDLPKWIKEKILQAKFF